MTRNRVDDPTLASAHTCDYPRLTWAQCDAWFWHCYSRSAYPRGYFKTPPGLPPWTVLLRRIQLAPPIDPEAIKDALRKIVERHESLRTVVGVHPSGRPFQRLLRADVELVTRDVGNKDLELVGESLGMALSRQVADIYKDRPFIAGLIRSPSTAILLIVVHHVAVDGWGFRILQREIYEALHPQETKRNSTIAVPQPAGIARDERSSGGTLRMRRALNYARASLSESPQSMFIDLEGFGEPSIYEKAVLRSSEAFELASTTALRLKITAATVWLAAYSILLATASGLDRCAFRNIVANRVTSDMKRTVANRGSSVTTLVHVPPHASFREIARNAWTAMFQTTRHGGRAKSDFERVVREVGYVRGVWFRDQAGFNYLTDPSATKTDIEGAVSSIVTFTVGFDPSEFAMRVRPSESAVALTVNTTRVGPARGALEALERLLGAIAHDPELLVSKLADLIGPLGPRPSHQELARFEHSWVRLDLLRQVLETHPTVRAAAVFLEANDGHTRGDLTAYIVPEEDRIRAFEIRSFVMANLEDSPSIVCPSQFVIVAPTGGLPTSVEGWRDLPALEISSGLDRPIADQRLVATPLVRCYRKLHGISDVDTSASFIRSGGDLELIPALLSMLRREGQRGLRFADFYSERSLEELNAQLVSVRPTSPD